jgi:PHD/YefM family antitoxin component YafN of YafNO toxin-antitoxin module
MTHNAIRLPSADDSIAPVTILDGNGNVVRVISAEEFRRDHPTLAASPSAAHRRRRRATE